MIIAKRDNSMASGASTAVFRRLQLASTASLGSLRDCMRRHAVLSALAEPGRVDVESFDVFDTVLTRAVGDPGAVALLLGRRLARLGLLEIDASAFARQRRAAEERAFARRGEDPSLSEIHAELAHALARPELTDDLVEYELALEWHLSRAMPDAMKLLSDQRERGLRVIFVSDTNLSEPDLVRLLAQHGLWSSSDRAFSSCQAGASKARGTLYPYVAQALGVRPWRIRHRGDNVEADVRNARLSSWRALHSADGELTRYERALEQWSSATGGLTSALAGASRLARVGQPTDSARDRTLVDVSAGVVGPVLTAWVIWVLRAADAAGLRRLYFLSRDGQVLLDLARRLQPRLRTQLELRYLHGSRQAWLLAGVDDPLVLGALNDDRDFRSVRTVAMSLGLAPTQLAHALPAQLRGPDSWDRDLHRLERQELHWIGERAEIREQIAAVSAARAAALGEYLRQEGMEQADSAGVVDVGWRGRTARALAGALERNGLPVPARFFSFGVGDDAHRIVGPRLVPRLSAYYYDAAAQRGFVNHPANLAACIEMFCAADHGTVTGYQRAGGRVHPTLARRPDAVLRWGLPQLRGTLAAFADTVLLDPDLVDVGADVRPALADLLELFWESPTAQEVEVWGQFPADVDQAHTRQTSIAHPVSIRSIANFARAGRIQLRPTQSWPAGTALVSRRGVRLVFKTRWRLGAELPRARRRAGWLLAQLRLLSGRF